MGSSIISLIGILILGFILYTVVKDKLFGTEGFEMNNQPGQAALEIRQLPVAPPRTITPSGPSSPAQAPPEDEEVVYGEPHAVDPYADKQEASDAPENMRYPERSYRPAPDNNQTVIASQAGIAGYPGQTSPQAYQSFNTEFVQNSGEFMNGVYANDSVSPSNFSAF
jgi:hypothetical protein